MAHKDDSAPIRLLQLVWDSASNSGGDSWRRLNDALQTALGLAIRSGMRFGPGDFTVIGERFRPEYWMRLGSDDGESWFASAVVDGNVSAAVAYEKWKGRSPFLWNGIEQEHGPKYEGARRLFVGAWFKWKGERVSVTKFDNDGDALRACSYVQPKGKVGSYWSRGKVVHRYVIKRSELQAVRKTAEDEKRSEKKATVADERKLRDPDYLEALLRWAVGPERVGKLRTEGAAVVFWRSDADGKPCNSGSGGPRHVGMIEEEKGPLLACRKGALHGTMEPDMWRGERLWAAALYPPVIKVDEEKYASLKREILAEIKSLPPYKELLGLAQAAT